MGSFILISFSILTIVAGVLAVAIVKLIPFSIDLFNKIALSGDTSAELFNKVPSKSETNKVILYLLI